MNDESKPLKEFDVVITETLKRTIPVEATDALEAEQIVSDQWNASIHILGADDFIGVKFETSRDERKLSRDADLVMEGGNHYMHNENIVTQLFENEHVSQLLNILQENNKSTAGLNALINHIGEMEQFVKSAERKIADMKQQLDEIKEIQNHPIKNSLKSAITSLESIVADMKNKIAELKDNIIDGCKKAVSAFKEKGISALSNLASFFKIRQSLENWKDNLDTGIRINDKTITKIEAFSTEYHATGRHLKNMARVAIGKAPIDKTKEAGQLAKAVAAPYKAQISIQKRLKGVLDRIIKRLNKLETSIVDKNPEQSTTKSLSLMERIDIYKDKVEQNRGNLPALAKAKAQGIDI